MKSATAVIWLVCLIAIIQSCNSTKCYSCIFPLMNDCDKIRNDQYLIDCPKNLVCGSAIFSSETIKIVTRECELKGTIHSLKTCSSDRCNGNKMVSNVTPHNNTGEGIKCYECFSLPGFDQPNPKCEVIEDDKYLTTCNKDEVCDVLETLDAGGNIQKLYRGCLPKNAKISSQVHCDENGCNGKNTVAITKNNRIKHNILRMFKHNHI